MPTVGTVRTRTRSWASYVRLQDPNRERDAKRELVYEFGSGRNKRKFYERRPYTPPEDEE